MPVMNPIDSYAEAFEAVTRARAGEPAWLRALRRDAFERFRAVGFPTTRQEDWRFTNIAPLAATPFRLSAEREPGREAARHLDAHRFAEAGWTELVFVNGRYAARLSRRPAPAEGGLPSRRSGREAGVRVASIGDLLRTDGEVLRAHLPATLGSGQRPFAELNAALAVDGAVVHVPANVVGEGAIHLLFYSEPGTAPTMSHPRVLIVVEDGAHARIVETYAGAAGGRYFTNQVTGIVVGASASVAHYKLQREAASAFHVGAIHVRLGRDSRLSSQVVMAGGQIARSDIEVAMEGEGADCTLNGVYLGSGDRLVDNHTSIDHAVPHCTSHEVYKGILDGRARGVFNGKILVRPGAQKTDAKQTNKVLLLSDAAQIDTKPQLEIFADDVKCTHGATVGQLSEEALFYLRTRGLGADDARNLLIYAFASEVVSRIDLEPVRRALDRLLLAELPLGRSERPAAAGLALRGTVTR
jgi:Fe-S cluster assembly protein SufD